MGGRPFSESTSSGIVDFKRYFKDRKAFISFFREKIVLTVCRWRQRFGLGYGVEGPVAGGTSREGRELKEEMGGFCVIILNCSVICIIKLPKRKSI